MERWGSHFLSQQITHSHRHTHKKYPTSIGHIGVCMLGHTSAKTLLHMFVSSSEKESLYLHVLIIQQ